MSMKRFVVRAGFAITPHVVCVVLGSVFLLAQSSEEQSKTPGPTTAASGAASVQEFPVTMRQNVVAGKTPVGTKVEAKLTIATLVKGAVIPEGAIFSGEVIDSAAKSKTDPSRLAIRMDSVQWKNGSKPITVYLTAWYYPLTMREIEIRPEGVDIPNPRMPPDPLPPPPPRVAESRVAMKNVGSARGADGTITLSSAKSNIKLDKTTTYVLATGQLTPESNPGASDRTK